MTTGSGRGKKSVQSYQGGLNLQYFITARGRDTGVNTGVGDTGTRRQCVGSTKIVIRDKIQIHTITITENEVHSQCSGFCQQKIQL